MKLGADDYLTKPFGRSDLLDAVRSRLERFTPREVPAAARVDVANAATLHAGAAHPDAEGSKH